MNWSDKQTWKNCFVSTFLCVVGCSVGTMGTSFYLAAYNWLYGLVVSFLTGLFTCIIFIAFWNIAFRQINFKEAIKSSFKMSIVSMVIIIGTENIIMLLTHSQHSARGMRGNYSDNLVIIFIAMSIGFLFALPYNYYILTKTGKVCH
jgi:Domain of unknown function (DUF4396)